MVRREITSQRRAEGAARGFDWNGWAVFVRIESARKISDYDQQNAAVFRDDHGIVPASRAGFCRRQL
jgi:hypothetical protein